MRIRKRSQNLNPPPDLSSPPSLTAAAAAIAAEGGLKAGGKEGVVVTATAGGGLLHGSGGGSSGGGGRGLHPNGVLPAAQRFHGCTTEPISRPPFHPLEPLVAATADGEELGDLPPPRPRLFTSGKAPKREKDGENSGPDGDAPGGAGATAPKSPGADESELSLVHGGYKMVHDGVAAAAAVETEPMAMRSDEERGFPLRRRSGCYRARGTRSQYKEDGEEEVAGTEKEMKPSRPSDARKRVATSSATTVVGTAGTSLITHGVVHSRGAPISAGAGAAEMFDGVVVKEEGGDGASATRAAMVGGNRGSGNGKKRRSPAVLMEGSRCSRVNGRGWRCCQQTLVGYSLCEHHLGKGRLQSVASVRCNGRARARKKLEDVDGAAPSPPSPAPRKQEQQQLLSRDGEDEEDNPGVRRRRKIGTVKARSISSLLHRADCWAPTASAAPEPSPSPSPAPAARTVTAAAAPPQYDSDTIVA